MNCTEMVMQFNFIPLSHRLTLFVTAYICKLIICQREALLERESSRFPANAVLVMRGWRLYPRALRMILGSGGSGNKKIHSDYLWVGHGWIR